LPGVFGGFEVSVVTGFNGMSNISFDSARAEQTGSGWVFSGHGVRFSDGAFAVHTHWAFSTEKEAEEERSAILQRCKN